MFSQGARQPASSLALKFLQEASCRQETGMNRCLHCKKPFGLVRKTIGMFWWTKEFCSKRCADDYVNETQQQEKLKQFLSYLSRPA